MSKLKLKHFGIAKRQVHQIIQIHNRNLSEKTFLKINHKRILCRMTNFWNTTPSRSKWCHIILVPDSCYSWSLKPSGDKGQQQSWRPSSLVLMLPLLFCVEYWKSSISFSCLSQYIFTMSAQVSIRSEGPNIAIFLFPWSFRLDTLLLRCF